MDQEKRVAILNKYAFCLYTYELSYLLCTEYYNAHYKVHFNGYMSFFSKSMAVQFFFFFVIFFRFVIKNFSTNF